MHGRGREGSADRFKFVPSSRVDDDWRSMEWAVGF
jgi:hypothetical protein